MLFHPEILDKGGLSPNNKSQNELQIVIQTKYNRKRIRKRGRRHHKREKDFKEVLYAIFEKYELIDHIAPSEIDPYWAKIYKFYEYVKYLKTYIIKSIIYDDRIVYWGNIEEIKDILITLFQIESKLFNYLCGYFEVLVRLALKKRFWGWKFYFNDIFYPEIWATMIENVKTLAFDVDRSKPSVYFVNMGWFKGLQITNEIMSKLKTEKFFYFDSKGRLVFKNDDQSFKFDPESTFEETLSNIESLDLFKELENYFKGETIDDIVKEIQASDIPRIDDINKRPPKKKLKSKDENDDQEQQISILNGENLGLTEKHAEDYMENIEKQNLLSSITQKIMNYFNFSSPQDIDIFKIKDKIKDINFTDQEKEFLIENFNLDKNFFNRKKKIKIKLKIKK